MRPRDAGGSEVNTDLSIKCSQEVAMLELAQIEQASKPNQLNLARLCAKHICYACAEIESRLGDSREFDELLSGFYEALLPRLEAIVEVVKERMEEVK